MTITALNANLQRVFGKSDSQPVSIDEWLGKHDDKRHVFFYSASSYTAQANGGKAWGCSVSQESRGGIRAEALGHTTAEAFWAAIEEFDKITGGIYRSGK